MVTFGSRTAYLGISGKSLIAYLWRVVASTITAARVVSLPVPAVVGIVIAIICLIVFGSQNFMLPSLIISSMILLVKQGGTSYE